MHDNQNGGPAECLTKFSQIRVGQFFEFQGSRYRKVALSMAEDETSKGNVFSSETEVLPGPMDPSYVSTPLRRP